MAFIPNFSICESSGCNSLSFSETTGIESLSNPSGYGGANPSTTNIASAILTVTLDNGTTYPFTLTPTTDSSIEYTITPAQLGYTTLGATIPDQIITFKYTLITNASTPVTYIQVYVKAFYCKVECCVNTMFADLDFECDCSVDETNKALKAFAMLQGLKLAAGCSNVTNFNNILTQLTKLCSTTSCGSCN